jgi:superfamily II DNA/RNA helicase
MGRQSLADKVYSLESFQKQFNLVLQDAVCQNFPELKREQNREDYINHIDINNLLSTASILYQSEKYEHLDAALRIAQYVLSTSQTSLTQRIATTILLEGLTNKPAINLALKRQLIPNTYKDSIPFPFQLEIIGRDVGNCILDSKEAPIFLNRFQKEVYDKALTTDLISISAPTSAGKSFILSRIILETLSNTASQKNIVYIVPTRALISQVEADFREMITNYHLMHVYISSVPQYPEPEFNNSTKVFVFTQERLHWFRTEFPLFKIDLLIVDEAQKIEDSARGILLQQKIEDLIRDFPDIKIFFSSPYSANPEFLLSELPEQKSKAPIKTEFTSVNQNLIYVNQRKGEPRTWELVLCTKAEKIKLGSIEVKFRPTSEFKRLAFVVESLADKEGGNIIYSNGAAFAERIANILFDVLSDDYKQISDEVLELMKLVKKTVHSKYVLAKVLSKKIAFHYGNMPLIIRQEIERLFKKGDIHFIICTSTLLEGVNLPAKSIFIKNPTRGNNNPMNRADFWNLAGRAGRWGKEFQGNVICIEPDQWTNPPSPDRDKQVIKKAVDEIVNKAKELIDFIKSDSPRNLAKARQDLETSFTYFYIKYLQGFKALPNKKTSALFEQLLPLFHELNQKITIPSEIIIRNPSISPIAQQNLFNYFQTFSQNEEELIPDLPESTDAINNSYLKLNQTINNILSGDPEALAYYQAILIVNWMRGYPLSLLIQSSYEYWQRRKPKKLDEVIRDTMKDVEEFARFKFAKFSSCYIDILRYFFMERGKEDLIKNIPQLHIWLEFGVSQQTQVSLINLGLSRNTSIILSEFIANDQLNRNECLDWIRSTDISILGLSPIIQNEVQRIVKSNPEK